MTYKEYIGYLDYISGNGKEQTLADYGYPADCPWDAETLQQAFDIMDAAVKNDIDGIMHHFGLPMAAFGRMFDIPYRSLQDWHNGKRTPPQYIIQMAAYILIMQLPTIETE